MNSIKITSILVTLVSAAFATYENITVAGGSEHEVVSYADPAAAERLDAVYSRPLSNVSDCGKCVAGGCRYGKHKFTYLTTTQPDRSYEEGEHGCEIGVCSIMHPESTLCTTQTMALSDVEKQMIWDSATGDSSSSLADLLEAFGEEVVAYNGSRNAIQVRGCEGFIIMSIPLSNAQTVAQGL